MKARTLKLLAGIWLLLVVLAIQQGWTASARNKERENLLRQISQLDATASALRSETAATLRDFTSAEAQLAALPAVAAIPPATPEREAQITAWLIKVKKVRQLFEDNPAQSIPELQLLPNPDWLLNAKTANLDTPEETRRTMAHIRTLAIGRFTSPLAGAMRKFTAANPGQKPADIHALAEYFETPADPRMLVRYEIVTPSSTTDLTRNGNWSVRLKEAVDPDYDTRPRINVTSVVNLTSTRGPLAWDSALNTQYQRASEAYNRVQGRTRVPAVADLLPYFDPPLDPVAAERLLRSERP